MDFELKTFTFARVCAEKYDALVVLAPPTIAGNDPASQLAAQAIKAGDFEPKPGKLLVSYRPVGIAATRLVLVGVGDGSAKNVRAAVPQAP